MLARSGKSLSSLRHTSLILLLSLPALAPARQDGAGASKPGVSDSAGLSNDQIRQLIRQAAEKDMANDKAQRDYTYIEREDEHKLDGSGQVKSSETRTYDIMVLFEEPVRKLIAKNDKALSAKDAAKEEEKIQRVIDKRKNESEDDRRKRLEKEEKNRERDRQFVKEVADAYNFHLVGTEVLEGRDTYMIDADPRPGYEPHLKDAKFLPKFRFRVWLDKAETQWVKLDIQCIDTVSVGLFLLRLHKGSEIQIEQTHVNDEVWLPRHVVLKLDARIALLKGIDLSEDVTYRDYKKFRAESKLVGVGEVQEPKP
jgi:hypothetical protein